MEKINIKINGAPLKALRFLEKKELIRLLRPSPKALNTRARTGAVDVHYRAARSSGRHCLMGIGKRNTEIQFSFHNGSEDIILLNPGRKKYKPLYFAVSLLKKKEFLRKLETGKLSAHDFAAVRLRFNDPATMFFTVLKDTVHCELTVPGPGQHPVFFVTEPDGLGMTKIRTKKCKFCACA